MTLLLYGTYVTNLTLLLLLLLIYSIIYNTIAIWNPYCPVLEDALWSAD